MMDEPGVSGSKSVVSTTSAAAELRTFHQTALATPRDVAAPVAGGINVKKLRLPHGFNVVAVRETLLAEAPFVNRGNKQFWRRMMDNDQFICMITTGFHHVVECIMDSGMVDLEKFCDTSSHSELLDEMGNSLAEIFFSFTREERDVFLPKLPELLCFVWVNALQAALPRHQRVFNSFRFREIILDWSTELLGGIRSMNVRAGREWFFQDAVEMPVMTTGSGSIFQAAVTDALAVRKTVLPLNSVGCRYNLDHSPLVARYIDKNGPSVAASTAKNILHVTMTHDPGRPLLSLQKGLDKTVRFRERRVDAESVNDYRKEAAQKRVALLKEYNRSKNILQEDIGKLRTGMRAAIAMLKSGKAAGKSDTKALLASALVTGTA